MTLYVKATTSNSVVTYQAFTINPPLCKRTAYQVSSATVEEVKAEANKPYTLVGVGYASPYAWLGLSLGFDGCYQYVRLDSRCS